MKTIKKIAEDYYAKSSLSDRIGETVFMTSADIERFVISEIVEQEKAIKLFILQRINKLKTEHKKIIDVYPTLSDSMKTVKNRRVQAIERAISELKFLMLKTNGKLKRDSSYPRL